MKTAKEWIDEYVQDKQLGFSRKLKIRNGDLVRAIQDDALKEAAIACLPVSTKCAGRIMEMRSAAMPNVES